MKWFTASLYNLKRTHLLHRTLTSGQLENNVGYSSENRHFSDRHHSDGNSGIDMSATKMQAAHCQGRNTQPKWQRNQLRRRRMARIPRNGGTSGQENEKESRDQLHQGAGPEMNTFQLRH